MKFDPDVHHRRSIRLKGFDYSRAGAYFVTICTHERLCTLGEVLGDEVALSAAGAVVSETWLSLPRRFAGVQTDAFTVMPNHVHGIIFLVGAQFIAPEPRTASQRRPLLGEVIRTFKAASTRLTRENGAPGFGWQRGYFEHVIRNDADLRRIREYIEANPLRWNEDPENPAVEPSMVRDEFAERLRAQ